MWCDGCACAGFWLLGADHSSISLPPSPPPQFQGSDHHEGSPFSPRVKEFPTVLSCISFGTPGTLIKLRHKDEVEPWFRPFALGGKNEFYSPRAGLGTNFQGHNQLRIRLRQFWKDYFLLGHATFGLLFGRNFEGTVGECPGFDDTQCLRIGMPVGTERK